MKPTVSVKFRNNGDYSNTNKNRIIFTLPGHYRVSQEALNDMDKGGTHHFEFQTKEVAEEFARKLFSSMKNVLDITTKFIDE
ncbi:hypothetical protein [Nitrosomonas communis]|uniref:Uncharacterized protein n=1 Tax=Nitrosomonas communis TaxID=44574 RepID=A0A1H2SQ73_9PROT|nr:hypothetical protein [Nitrosomonas communis]SDW33728.1 hypothetical protein SAMN05421882_10089 [Nitrosomonas communis]